MPDELDEAVQRVARGERAAFGRVVELSTPRLFRLAARMIGNPEEAEDVLQDAFIRAFDALVDGRFDGRSGAFTWLYRVVTNASLDAMRSRKRRRARFEPEGETEPAAPIVTDDHLGARAALRELDVWLADLPEDQRAALVLKEVEGMTTQEVAEVTGSSVGAVEQRLVRARATLRKRSERG